MSQARKCDRCKKFYDIYNEKRPFGRIDTYVLQNGDNVANNDVQYRDEQIDLCPDCANDFGLFMAKPDMVKGWQEYKAEILKKAVNYELQRERRAAAKKAKPITKKDGV